MKIRIMLLLILLISVMSISMTDKPETNIYYKIFGGYDTKIQKEYDSLKNLNIKRLGDNITVVIEEPAEFEVGKSYELKIYIGAIFNPNITVKEYAETKELIIQNEPDNTSNYMEYLSSVEISYIVPEQGIRINYDGIKIEKLEEVWAFNDTQEYKNFRSLLEIDESGIVARNKLKDKFVDYQKGRSKYYETRKFLIEETLFGLLTLATNSGISSSIAKALEFVEALREDGVIKLPQNILNEYKTYLGALAKYDLNDYDNCNITLAEIRRILEKPTNNLIITIPFTVDKEVKEETEVVIYVQRLDTAMTVTKRSARKNLPPETPKNPEPANERNNISVESTLTWQCEDPDGDDLVYDIYLGTDKNPKLVKENHNTNKYNPGKLNYGTTYYWKVVAKDKINGESESELWKFTTEERKILWRYKTNGWVTSSPAMDEEGTIYIGSNDGYLYAINPDGTLKWKYETEDDINSSPAIGKEGTIYVGSWDSCLYAIKNNSQLKWKYETDEIFMSAPAIGGNGTIYIGNRDGNLYAISDEGELKWKFETKSLVKSSPAIGSDGTIYVGSDDNYLYAINPDGTLKWKYKTGKFVYSSPTIDTDGTIYVGSGDSYLYAINPDGKLKWKFATSGSVNSSPAIGADGTIYVGSSAFYFYAINPDGTLKWKYKTGSSVNSSPAIGAEGTIYVGSNDGYLYALNPDGTLKTKYEIKEWVMSSPLIDEEGIIYLGSRGDYIYALIGESKGLANSPWPMYRNNPRHTGRTEQIDRLLGELINPTPNNNAKGISINTTLSWECSDPDGDSLTYDIYFGTSSSPSLKKTGHTSKSYNPGTLSYNTAYYWKIVAKDGKGGETTGPLWRFTTKEEPAPPPEGMVLVEGGTFQMGDTWGDGWAEKPVHEVTLTYDFYIGKYEVTFEQYDKYCEDTGKSKPDDEGWGRGEHPVIYVSWYDAIEYCNWLSEEEGLPKAYDEEGNLLDRYGNKTTDITKVEGYRLPTEAEWEYAARGGNKSKGYKYAGSDEPDEVAWYDDNSGFHTHEVGTKKPNELGIYDMTGNVWEWCQDRWYLYTKTSKTNPYNHHEERSGRVLRGGSWLGYAYGVRVAYRYYSPPDFTYYNGGFRVCRTAF